MTRMNVTEIQEQLPTALANHEPVILRKGRHDIGAVISMPAYRLMEKLMERYEDEIDLREARKAIAEAKEKGFIPWEQVKGKAG